MAAIITFFETIINFIGTFLTSILWLLTMIPKLWTSLAATLAFTPPVFQGFLIGSLSLTVLFAIIRLL